MKQYIVDAFTDEVFHGNPAAICVMDEWPAESLMMSIAMENNLSETAFIVKEPAGYHLRWFTPTCEVGLCGHATLASGFVARRCCLQNLRFRSYDATIVSEGMLLTCFSSPPLSASAGAGGEGHLH